MGSDRTRPDWHTLMDCLLADVRNRALGKPGDAKSRMAWSELLQWLRLYGLTAVRHSVSSLTSGDIEDVIQETILKLQNEKMLITIQSAKDPQRYLSRMLKNAAVDRLRQISRERKGMIEVLRDGAAVEDPREDHARQSLIRKLGMEMSLLSKEERKLLHMVYWQGLSIKDAADKLGEKYSTVATRLFRSVKKLRGRL